MKRLALEQRLLRATEALVSRFAESRQPTLTQLQQAHIVAHRGQHDGNQQILENTVPAFDPVVAAGVASIEFDIRYTADDEPIVLHDANLSRVFGHAGQVDQLKWSVLRQRAPQIPHLEDILARYSGRVHCMIELKTRGSQRAENRLREYLAPLRPAQDYHIMAQDTRFFEALNELPGHIRIPIATTNLPTIRNWCRHHECGGMAGPFPLINQTDIDLARQTRRLIGSGYITRQAILMHEIARGIGWIFTDHPLYLQQMLDRAIATARV